MPRPILLGICGDSGAGKTTLTRGLVRILGEAQVTHIDGDHYHRHSRTRRAELGVTPLHPDANHLDILEQHLVHLRAGEPILKPVYRHRDGTLAPAEYVTPAQFTIVEGMLGFHTRRCATPTTCASSWTRPRICAAAGRSNATAAVAATPPTRSWPSSTAARPTPRRSSAPSAATPTSSSRSCPATAATPSTSTPSSRCAPGWPTRTCRR